MNDLTEKLERRKKLESDVALGNHASSAKFIIDEITDGIIEEAKNDFEKLPILDYQDIDKRAIFVLQLKMEVAKTIQARVKSYIAEGEKARKEIAGEE